MLCKLKIIIIPFTVFIASGCATLSPQSEQLANNASEQELSQLIAIGDDALRKGDINTAQVKYALVIEKDSNNVGVLYKLGMIHKEQGALEISEGLLRRALTLNPDHQGSLEALGMVLLKQERLDDSRTILTDALEKRTNSWQVLNALGIIEDMDANHIDAQEYFGAALSIVPRSPKLLNNLGYSHYLAGNYNTAETYFKEAIQYDADNPNAWSNLGLTYSRLGRHSDARASFRKIVDDHQAANNMGYLALMQDQRDLALTEFTQAISSSPSYYERANQNLVALRNYPLDEGGANKQPGIAKTGNSKSSKPVSTTSIVTLGRGSEADVILNKTITRDVAIKRHKEPTIVEASFSTSKKKTKANSTRLSQMYLNYLGYNAGVADGKPGAKTKAAIATFQNAYGFNVTGKLNKKSRAHLSTTALIQMQTDLITLGFQPGEPDGKLGRGTQSALQQFSSTHNLKYSGMLSSEIFVILKQNIENRTDNVNSPETVDLTSRG